VEVTLSLLSEVAGMVFLHHDSVVMHATSVTATTGMLSSATNTTMSHLDVTSHRSCLFQPCDLLNELSFETPTISSKDRFNNKLSIPNPLFVNAQFFLSAFIVSTSSLWSVVAPSLRLSLKRTHNPYWALRPIG
jgi:hypothetical protein